jgi:hypothetical protein
LRWKDLTLGSQFSQVETLKKTYSNMKFTILATVFAALATIGFSAAATADADADAIPVAAVDETTPQRIMNGSEGNHRVLRANEPVADNEDEAAPDGGAPVMEGKRVLGTKGAPSGGNKKDYSGQSCSLCCDDDYHC